MGALANSKADKPSILAWSKMPKGLACNACSAIRFPVAVVFTIKAMPTATTFLSAQPQSMPPIAPFAQTVFTRNQEYATKFLPIAPLTTRQLASASPAKMATFPQARPASSQP